MLKIVKRLLVTHRDVKKLLECAQTSRDPEEMPPRCGISVNPDKAERGR
jgi:hypothetical protein